MAPQFFLNHRIFGKFNASSVCFRTFAVGKENGFEFYRKVIKRGPLLHRFLDAPVTHTVFIIDFIYPFQYGSIVV